MYVELTKLLFISLICLVPLKNVGQGLTIQQVNDKVFVYITYHEYEGEQFPSNSLYVLTSAGAVLIDTPWDTTQVQPLIDSIQQRHHVPVIACISTHFHEDRTAGLHLFRARGVATWSSQLTKEFCRKEGYPEAEYTFMGDTSFIFGDTRIETFYPGKGHAPDNIVVWIDKYRILVGGCFVKSTESPTLGNLSHADVKAWPVSMRKLMQKYPDPDFIIPGHFGWLQHNSLEHTLKLLRRHKS